eukprot:TRINITY_DN15575_c0_g1_i2.p1 TRINITY_DN15575_c0_g1~~TRINITY_DN15575_c0_g1_i2.p1  ORF type:complete len:341 (+),score=62.21 TRINITY_DN15575_c0_g1_i2:145-1167(+)
MCIRDRLASDAVPHNAPHNTSGFSLSGRPGSYLSFPSYQLPSSAVTISLWVTPRSLCNTISMLLGEQCGPDARGGLTLAFTGQYGAPHLKFAVGSDCQRFPTTYAEVERRVDAIVVGELVHIVASFDPGRGLRLYANGSLVGQTFHGIPTQFPRSGLYCGAEAREQGHQGRQYMFQGQVHNVTVFPEVLPASVVMQLFFYRYGPEQTVPSPANVTANATALPELESTSNGHTQESGELPSELLVCVLSTLLLGMTIVAGVLFWMHHRRKQELLYVNVALPEPSSSLEAPPDYATVMTQESPQADPLTIEARVKEQCLDYGVEYEACAPSDQLSSDRETPS